MNVISGKLKAPVKAIVYGPEKSGKSSLASALPSPVFLDIEHGTSNLDVSRLPCETLAEVKESIKWLATGDHSFATLVIDSADWLEQLINKNIIEKAKDQSIQSIEDFGYGKGWTKCAEAWKEFLCWLAPLMRRGMNIVFITHSRVKTVNEPGKDQGYDHYEMNIAAKASPLISAWADMILFINFYTHIAKTSSGKAKVTNGKERRIYTTHCAIYDAGNRYNLPEELRYDFDEDNLAPIVPEEILEVFTERSLGEKLQKAETKEETQSKKSEPSVNDEESIYPDYKELVSLVDQLSWLNNSADEVQTYMRKNNWIDETEIWSDASPQNLKRIVNHPVEFAKKLGIKGPTTNE
jgi:hypothetical protein